MSIELTADQIAELQTAEAAMMPAPWHIHPRWFTSVSSHLDPGNDATLLEISSDREDGFMCADARGIVLLRNHAPALIAAAEREAEARNDLEQWKDAVIGRDEIIADYGKELNNAKQRIAILEATIVCMKEQLRYVTAERNALAPSEKQS